MQIAIGDKVQIVDKGKRYTTYTKMYDIMKEEYPQAKPYASWEQDREVIDFNRGKIIGIVKCIKKHLYSNILIALVEIGECSFLFDVLALRVIQNTQNVKETNIFELFEK